MPDITLCEGGNCPNKESCYRYKATPSQWQSYFTAVPFKIDENLKFECQYYDEFKPALRYIKDNDKPVSMQQRGESKRISYSEKVRRLLQKVV